MNARYSKNEKLKSRTSIKLLFTHGRYLSKPPILLVFTPESHRDNHLLKIGVSVSKKHFKKAVDRNRIKRQLREAYRLNKHLLADNLDKPHSIMLLYKSKELLLSEEINTKTIELFKMFVNKIKV